MNFRLAKYAFFFNELPDDRENLDTEVKGQNAVFVRGQVFKTFIA